METNKQHLNEARKDFLSEFVKIKYIIEIDTDKKKTTDKARFFNSIKKILGFRI